MDFQRQATRAKFISRNPLSAKFYGQVKGLKLENQIANRDYDGVLKNFVQTRDMNYLQDKAYAEKKGYSIGYVKGKKVMFVSGSRNKTDWAFNVVDEFLPKKLQVASNRTANRLTNIAKDNDVDLVVGHSRGATLVAKMDVPDHKKLGLDGAMRLAPREKRGMMNLYQKNTLDKVISRRGSNRKGYKMKSYSKYHFISRDYKGYKGPQARVVYKKRSRMNPLRYAGMKKRRVVTSKWY